MLLEEKRLSLKLLETTSEEMPAINCEQGVKKQSEGNQTKILHQDITSYELVSRKCSCGIVCILYQLIKMCTTILPFV